MGIVSESGVKIIIAERSPGEALQILYSLGYNKRNIEVVYSGDALLKKTEAEYFDIIIIQKELNDYNGFELCLAIRKQIKNSETPIFFILDAYVPAEIEKVYDSGGHDYLIKPIIKQDLLAKITLRTGLKQKTERLHFLNKILNTKIKQRFEFLAKEIQEFKDAYGALQDSAIHFQQLSDKTPLGTCTLDLNGNVTYANQNLFRLLDHPRQNITEDFNWLDCPFIKKIGLSERFTECIEKQKLIISELSYKSSNNKRIYIRANISPLFDLSNKLAGAEIMIEDFSMYKRAEELIKLERDITYLLSRVSSYDETLKITQELLQKQSEIGATGIYVNNGQNEFRCITKSGFKDNFKIINFKEFPLKELILKGQNLYIGFQGLMDIFREEIQSILDDNTRALAVLPVVYENKTVAVFAVAFEFYDEIPDRFRNFLESLSVQISEFYDRLNTKQNLQKSEENYRTIVEGQTDLISRFSPDGTLKFVNLAYCRYFNKTYDELIGTNWIENSSERTQVFVKEKLKQLTIENPVQTYEYETYMPSGKPKWTEWRNKAIFDQNNQLIEYQSVGHDITLFKNTELQLKSILTEKERLLSEVHHRVKNNMQMVSSMLKLQAYNIDPENVVESFQVSVNRIKSMAIIHEKLYESKNFGEIDMNAYVKELSEDLIAAYHDNKDIALRVNIPPLMLEIDTAITLGLLLNELVTNSLKYAFYGRDRGEISISLFNIFENNYELIVEDDGIGLPDNFDEKNKKSLGMQLINGFTKELFGTIDYKSDKGTVFIVKFKQVRRSRINV